MMLMMMTLLLVFIKDSQRISWLNHVNPFTSGNAILSQTVGHGIHL